MIASITIFLAIIFVFSAAGSRIIKQKNSNIENFVISACIGLFVLSITVFVIGALGMLYRWVFVVLIILCFVISYKEIIGIFSNLIPRLRMIGRIFPSRFERFLIVIFVIVGIASLFETLAPETGNDALAYHLAHPKVFVEMHKIAAIEYARESLWPYFTEMLFTLGLLLQGQALAKLFHFGSAILLSLGIYAFGSKYFSRISGLLAATIFFATPAIFTQAGYSYIDIMVALYAFMSLYLFIAWRDSKRNMDLFLSGLFCGVCMSIKYLGIYVAICMTGIFLYSWSVGRKKSMFKAFFIFSVTAALIASVWYLRSYVITGNPFYPFFHQYFKNGWENPMRIACGTAKNLKNLMLLPWNVTMYPLMFGGESISVIYFMFLPFIFLWRGLKDIKVKTMLIFAMIFTLLWFATFQATRYLFAVLPILAILESASMLDVSKNYRKKNIIVFILLAAFAFNCAVALYHGKGVNKVVLGLESKEKYLTRTERSYAISEYINKNTPPGSNILTTEPRIYYYDRKMIYSDYYLNCNGLKEDISLKEMAIILKKDNFTHILLAVERPFDKEDKNISAAPVRIAYQSFFLEHTPEDRRYILLKL